MACKLAADPRLLKAQNQRPLLDHALRYSHTMHTPSRPRFKPPDLGMVKMLLEMGASPDDLLEKGAMPG